MEWTKLAAIVLIAAGILGLAFGEFSYTKDSKEASIGPLELTVEETETVAVPGWLAAGAILAGVGLLAYPMIVRR